MLRVLGKGSTLTRKGQKKNSYNETSIERIVMFLSLLFGYLDYFLELRPLLEKLGLYCLGFTDCFVLIFSGILITFVVTRALVKRV